MGYRVIIDACVGGKWFFEEPLTDKALQIMEAYQQEKILITVPGIFYPEIASICHKYVKRGIVTDDIADTYFKQMLKLSIDCYQENKLVEAALENAYLFGISIYDALYVSLAEFYCAPLITVDEELVKLCRRHHFELIESLKEFKLSGLF